jgi:putative ABC transport system substrate-binding protein
MRVASPAACPGVVPRHSFRGAAVKVTVLKLAVTLSLFIAPLGAAAQASKVDRIGYLAAGSPGPFLPVFEQGLRERGWVLGQNLVINYRHAEGKYDRLPVLATELAQAEPRVIVVNSTAAAHAAKNATSTIPIVMWGVADPIGEGLVSSLARPGGNVTGVTGVPSLETHGKYLQLLKEAVPHARRIAVLRNPANPASLPSLKVVKETAQTLAVELQIVEARAPAEFAPAFRAIAQARADALLLYYDAAFNPHLRRLADLSLRGHLPTMCGDPGYAKAGGFMNYLVNYVDSVLQVAGYVDKLLHGARPAELPVEQPTKFDLVINRKTAKTLGLTIPASLLLQASHLIE